RLASRKEATTLRSRFGQGPGRRLGDWAKGERAVLGRQGTTLNLRTTPLRSGQPGAWAIASGVDGRGRTITGKGANRGERTRPWATGRVMHLGKSVRAGRRCPTTCQFVKGRLLSTIFFRGRHSHSERCTCNSSFRKIVASACSHKMCAK